MRSTENVPYEKYCCSISIFFCKHGICSQQSEQRLIQSIQKQVSVTEKKTLPTKPKQRKKTTTGKKQPPKQNKTKSNNKFFAKVEF